jgi:hypothetical protein
VTHRFVLLQDRLVVLHIRGCRGRKAVGR